MYSAKIKLIRIARGLTQEEVARKIPVAANTYCKLEQDQRQGWPEDLLDKLAEALQVSSSDIKNPMPVLINFGPQPVLSQHDASTNDGINQLIDLLREQLRKKDEVIDSLLKVIKSSEK